MKKCQEILKKYQINNENDNRIRRRNEQIVPITIIDKDCHTIANTDLYAEIMTKNFINNIRTKKRLDIFQKEHQKRHRKSKDSSQKKFQRKTRVTRTTKFGGNRITNYSKLNQDRISINNYNSENINKVSDYMDIINSNTNSNSKSAKHKIETKSVDKENSGKYAKDKRQINSMINTGMFQEFDDEDEIDFDNDKGNININKEVNVIEERPEDEEKDKDNKIKIKDEKRKFKNYNKRVITGNKEGFSMTDFLMSKHKK